MSHGGTTRREFLTTLAAGAAASAGVAAWPALLRGDGASAGHSARSGKLAPTAPSQGELEAGPRSRLLSVINQVTVRGNQVSMKYLSAMFAAGLTRWVGADSEKDAWNAVVKPGEKVLIKFNRSGAEGLNTTEPMLNLLLDSMEKAGVERKRVMLLDVSADVQRRCNTAPPLLGFSEEPIHVLGRQEHLHQAVEWADCIINVPFVKDHHLAGVTCAMKNLSHGLIKRPARWHGDRCREAIPHLFATPAIRDKVRLHIVNGLRMVVDGGPAARQEHIVPGHRLLFGDDPVAIDAYAARLIDAERGARGLRDLAEDNRPPQYLQVARKLDLGQSDLDRIALTELEA